MSKGTRLTHGYMKQNKDETRNYTQRNNEGKNIIEQHISKYVVYLRIQVACNQAIEDLKTLLKSLRSLSARNEEIAGNGYVWE